MNYTEKYVYYNDVDGFNVNVNILYPVNGLTFELDDTNLL